MEQDEESKTFANFENVIDYFLKVACPKTTYLKTNVLNDKIAMRT